jgi:hypothetical protein
MASKAAMSLKDSLETLAAAVGAVTLLTPALGMLLRLVAFSVTKEIGYEPRLVIALPLHEVTFVGLLAAIPVMVVLAAVVLLGARITTVGPIEVAIVVVPAIAAAVFIPPFPSSLGYSFVVILAGGLIWNAKRDDHFASVLPWAGLLVVVSAVAFGFNYRAGQAADYEFDPNKAPGAVDGSYLRLAQDDTFIYLLSCSSSEQPTALPVEAVRSVRFSPPSFNTSPSLFDILRGSTPRLGVSTGC